MSFRLGIRKVHATKSMLQTSADGDSPMSMCASQVMLTKSSMPSCWQDNVSQLLADFESARKKKDDLAVQAAARHAPGSFLVLDPGPRAEMRGGRLQQAPRAGREADQRSGRPAAK